MRKRLIAGMICIMLFCEVLAPSLASAQGPYYSSDKLLYQYSSVQFSLVGTPYTTREMRYVNQFFNLGGTYSQLGNELKTWLDMSEKTTKDRNNSGYLMLEQEYLHENSFWQQVGYEYVKLAEEILETVGSYGINWLTDFGNYVVATGKFGSAGSYAQPYYDMLSSFVASYINELAAEMETMNTALDVISSNVKNIMELAVPNAIAARIVSSNQKYEFFISPNSSIGNVTGYKVTNFTSSTSPQGLYRLTEIEYSVGKTTQTATLDYFTEHLAKGQAFSFDLSELDATQALQFTNNIEAELGSVYGVKDGEIFQWSDSVNTRTISRTFEWFKSTKTYGMLSENQRQAIEDASKYFKKGLKDPSILDNGRIVNKLSVAFDFVNTTASWYNYFQQSSSLNAEQRAFMIVYSTITDEFISTLLDWNEAIESNTSIESENRERLSAAVLAVICDIYASRDEQMAKAQADWNSLIGSTGSLLTAWGNTAELIASALDFVGIQNPSVSNGVCTAAAIGSAALSWINNAYNYSNLREKVEVLYTAKKTLTDNIFVLLEEYKENRTHEKAVSIITNLNLLKKMKKEGEQLVALHYLQAYGNQLGIKGFPAAQVVFWAESLGNDNYSQMHAEFDRVWAVYKRTHKNTSSTSYFYDTLMGMYLRGDSKNVTYLGVPLQRMPERYLDLEDNRAGDASLTYWGVTDENTSWRSQQLPDIELKNSMDPFAEIYTHEHLFKEPMYLYKTDEVEIILSEDAYQAYLNAEQKAKELVEAYVNGAGKLDAKEHQTEERMLWARVTDAYIESFLMFDPTEDYYE